MFNSDSMNKAHNLWEVQVNILCGIFGLATKDEWFAAIL